MGYQIILDILGATILGGTFLLCLRSFQREDLRSKQESRDDFIDRQNLAAFIALMKEDFRRNGYAPTHEVMASPVVTRAEVDDAISRIDLPADRCSRGEIVGDRDVSSHGETYLDLRYRRHDGAHAARPAGPPMVQPFDGLEVTLRVKNQHPFTVAGTADSRRIVNAESEQIPPGTAHHGYLNP